MRELQCGGDFIHGQLTARLALAFAVRGNAVAIAD
jgi:hypothetical protein